MTETTLIGTLEDAGYRMTQPRRLVADLISRRDGHFTAADLVEEARERRLGIGRATIFRAIDALVGLGAVERLDLPNGEHAYVACDPIPRHHHHVICSSCGRTTEFVGCRLNAFLRAVEDQTGYSVDSHRVELFGICAACRARAS
jgi:Fur family ferric uptake transcriptional regulator